MLDKVRGYWHSAELLTAARMAEAGMIVSVPLVPARYDLIGDYAGRLVRVQVKRAKWRQQRVTEVGKRDRAGWVCNLTRHRGKGKSHDPLEDCEFDYLSVMCTQEDIYFIPVSALFSDHMEGKLKKVIQIKPPDAGNNRADAKESGERWEPYRNRFELKND